MAAVTPSRVREGILFGVCYVPGMGFPDGSVVKTLPGLGRSPGEGNGNPLQSSCLENLMDRGAWCTVARGAAKSWT